MNGNDIALLNLRWAETLTAGLAARGVERAVISPGSRSTPLVLAFERASGVTVHVHPDERSAAFFALGLARGSLRPVALVCTSGSAPGHWFPAVIEAAAAGVPLILLTADRPPELHDRGANQTIDQTRLFGSHVRAFHDPGPPTGSMEHLASLAARAVEQSLWPKPGPVHLNLPFREPLVPESLPAPSPPSTVPETILPLAAVPAAEATELAARFAGRPGLIVCGARGLEPGAPEAVSSLAAVLRVPVLADALSGLRFGPHDRSLVMAYADAWLRSENKRPEWILQVGGPPVSKVVQTFLETCGAADFVIADATGDWPDPGAKATRVVRAPAGILCASIAEEEPAPAPAGWLEHFRAAEDTARKLSETEAPPEARAVRALLSTLPAGATLFTGNSLPVREVDWFSGTGPHALTILANRGASGIDGHASTLLGLAVASPGPVVGLIGDLAFFHDLNGLLAAREAGANAVLIVVDNGGGGIFEHLPQAELPTFTEHWLAPTGIDLEKAAEVFGIRTRHLEGLEILEGAVTEALDNPGLDLLILDVDRNESVDRHRAYWNAVAAALGES